jgi:hypothetical protein
MFESIHLSQLSTGRAAAVAGCEGGRHGARKDGAPPGATAD